GAASAEAHARGRAARAAAPGRATASATACLEQARDLGRRLERSGRQRDERDSRGERDEAGEGTPNRRGRAVQSTGGTCERAMPTSSVCRPFLDHEVLALRFVEPRERLSPRRTCAATHL